MVATVGIDVGHSKCCIAVIRNGKVEVIENSRGSRTIPSYVAFTDTERLLGHRAKAQVVMNPINTLFGVKQLIGRRIIDESVKLFNEFEQCCLIEKLGKPRILVLYKGIPTILSPEQILAMLITELVEMASSYLGSEVRDAVISVPVYFTSAQRQATRDAAEIAGLYVLELINGTTAAAIAYRNNHMQLKEEKIMVVDFGGAGIDVSTFRIDDRKITVQNSFGSSSIGGVDIVNMLLAYFVNEIKKNLRIDLKENFKALERLRLACNEMKHSLSILPKAAITIDSVQKDIDYTIKLSRAKFHEMCYSRIHSQMIPIFKKFLDDSDVNELNKIVFVGGSTRIPIIEQIIKALYKNVAISKTVNLDESVACGAAIRAANLSTDVHYFADIIIQDILSYAIFLKRVNSNETIGIVEKGTQIPYSVSLVLLVKNEAGIYSVCSCDNGGTVQELCEVDITSDPCDRHSTDDVVLHINSSGEARVVVTHNGAQYSLNMSSDVCLDARAKAKFTEREKIFKNDSAIVQRNLEAMSSLEEYCLKHIDKLGSTFDDDRILVFIKKCESTLEWLDSHQTETKSDYDNKLKELSDLRQQYLNVSLLTALNVSDEYDIVQDIKNFEINENMLSEPSNEELNSLSENFDVVSNLPKKRARNSHTPCHSGSNSSEYTIPTNNVAKRKRELSSKISSTNQSKRKNSNDESHHSTVEPRNKKKKLNTNQGDIFAEKRTIFTRAHVSARCEVKNNARDNSNLNINQEAGNDVLPQQKSTTSSDASNEAKPQQKSITSSDASNEAKPQQNSTGNDASKEAKPQQKSTGSDASNEAKPQQKSTTGSDASNKAKPQQKSTTSSDASNEAKPQPISTTGSGSDSSNEVKPQQKSTTSSYSCRETESQQKIMTNINSSNEKEMTYCKSTYGVDKASSASNYSRSCNKLEALEEYQDDPNDSVNAQSSLSDSVQHFLWGIWVIPNKIYKRINRLLNSSKN